MLNIILSYRYNNVKQFLEFGYITNIYYRLLFFKNINLPILIIKYFYLFLLNIKKGQSLQLKKNCPF